MSAPQWAYAAALAALPGAGPGALGGLLECGAPQDAWEAVLLGDGAVLRRFPRRASAWREAASAVDVEDVGERYRAARVSVVCRGDAAYPDVLAADHAAPAVLFARGDLRVLDAHARVAVIGTRRCTAAGRALATQMGRDLAEAGVVVVSGLALGIDGAAHRGVLLAEGGAPPVAVVGSGLDIVYPRGNERLWREVADRGALLTEVPLGGRPEPWRFPLRNRILAALAQCVVVVESHAAGGSMLTVDEALTRSRDVLVVPGAPGNPAAAGTNALLVDGAVPVRDATDVLAHLPFHHAAPSDGAPARTTVREADAGADAELLACVDFAPTATDTVVARSGREPGDVALALHRLERGGYVHGAAGWWERVR